MTTKPFPLCVGSREAYLYWLKDAKKSPPENGYCGDADKKWCAKKKAEGLCKPKPAYWKPPKFD